MNDLIQPGELAAILGDPGLVILDATTAIRPDPVAKYRTEPLRAVFEAGHIPGAQFVDLQADLSDPDSDWRFMLPGPADFAAAMRRFGLRQGGRVIVYSTADPWWATRLWWMLRVFGHAQVQVLDGGWQGWQAAGGAAETGPGAPRAPGDFTARFHPELVAGRDDVRALMQAGAETGTIVNARSPAAFRGEGGDLYARPGRIPGSINVPAEALYTPGPGPMRPAEDQRAALAPVPFDRPVIVHCGHGIAASATAFALMRLGHPDVRIYDGSLSEWAADPALPLITGPEPAATTDKETP